MKKHLIFLSFVVTCYSLPANAMYYFLYKGYCYVDQKYNFISESQLFSNDFSLVNKRKNPVKNNSSHKSDDKEEIIASNLLKSVLNAKGSSVNLNEKSYIINNMNNTDLNDSSLVDERRGQVENNSIKSILKKNINNKNELLIEKKVKKTVTFKEN